MLRAVAVLFLAVSTAAWGQAYDPVTTDPPADTEFPAQIASLSTRSGDATINGRGLVAQGKGPHPTVLLLHGFPGNELNMDLAQAIRRAGWNVFMFHYRGSWGSGGQYAIANILEDTANVLDYLRTKAPPAWRVDPNRIVLMGHSMGGFSVLNTAAADPRVKSVAAMAAFDLGAAGEVLATNDAMRNGFVGFARSTTSVNIPDADAFIKSWTTAPPAWKFSSVTPKLVSKQVLLIAGTKDTVAPMARHHTPMATALKATPGSNLTEVVLEADHSFSDKRIALTRAVLAWLAKQ